MKRLLITLALAAALVLVALVALAAQQLAPPVRVQPMLIQVQQSIPMDLTVTISDTYTVTVPAAVDLNLAIRIGDTLTPTVVEAEPAQVTVQPVERGGELIDNNGIPYQVELPDNLQLIQWRTDLDYADNMTGVGQVRNTDPSKTLDDLLFYVSQFDQDGILLGVSTGMKKLNDIPPGATSPIESGGDVLIDDVASYLIQFEVYYTR